MRIWENSLLAVSALISNKTRSFLASVGIMIGIASVIVMVAIGKGSQKEVLDVISRMGENLITLTAGEVKRRGGKLKLEGNVTNLTVKEANLLLEEIDELKRVAPYEYKETKVKYRNFLAPVTVAGSTPEFLEVRKYSVADGSFFDYRDLNLAKRVAVLGKTTVKNIFGEEDPLGQVIRIESVPFTVIGVFESKGMDADGVDQDDILLTPLTTLLRRVMNQTFIRTIYFQAVSKESMDRAVENLNILLRSRHRLKDDQENDFEVQSQLELEKLKKETSETFTTLIVGVAAISLIVGGVGILAVMLTSVKERTREIGLRRAVGASQRDIVFQFLTESLLIGFLGGGVGIAIGTGLSFSLDQWGPWTLIVEPASIQIATGVCVAIGIVFGVFPAVKASRMDPMEALRIE